MARGLFTAGFLAINLQFFLVTGVAALFFAFSGYLQHLGVGAATSGLILSADALAALCVQPLISPWVHPGTARRWLAGGALVLSAALIVLANAVSVPWLLAARLVQGAGFICVLSALISSMVSFIPAGMSGRAFGWMSLVRLIPYAMIPFLFDRLSLAPKDFPVLLQVAAAAALVPLLMVFFPGAAPGPEENSAPPGFRGMSASLRSRPVAVLLVSSLLFFCGYAAMFFFLKPFGQSLGIGGSGLFFSVATGMMIAIRLGGGWLFDRFDKRMFCAAGLLIAAAGYLLLPHSRSLHGFLTLAAMTGLGWGIAMPLQAATMFDISLPADRAMNQNLLIVMMQGGFFLGPLAGGAVLSGLGYGALFIGIATATVLAALLMHGVRDTKRVRSVPR